MRSGKLLKWFACAAIGLSAVFAFQRPFRQFDGVEYSIGDVPLPADYREKTEWAFARLMYPEHPNALFGGWGRYGRRGLLDWREGGTSWTQDYPRADRHFAQALRRLTRIHVRSIEQPVNPDEIDDFFNWPWMNAGEMGDWKLTMAQARTLREYLLRGGFLMLDDFWGPEEYARFDESMKAVFPERPVMDMPNDDAIFHTVYDLDDRYQVLGEWGLNPNRGMFRRRALGTVAHWMGVYDDQGRVMVAISFNSDIGDSWEWADDPGYPEKFSALGIRIGVNYVVYAMTH